MELPIFAGRVSAGFPSPADDYVENKLDLNKYLIRHPEATFFLRVQGESMEGAGIYNGDLIIVDRSLKPVHKKIVVAVLNGEILVKRLIVEKKKVFLVAENPKYPDVEITEDMSFQTWGVVTTVIRKV